MSGVLKWILAYGGPLSVGYVFVNQSSFLEGNAQYLDSQVLVFLLSNLNINALLLLAIFHLSRSLPTNPCLLTSLPQHPQCAKSTFLPLLLPAVDTTSMS